MNAQVTFDETIANMRRFLAVLSPKERRILLQRHGINESCMPQTLEEVGKEMGVKRERVRQLEGKAREQMRFTIAGPETATTIFGEIKEQTPGQYARRFFEGDTG